MTGRCKIFRNCRTTIPLSSLKISTLCIILCGFYTSPNAQNRMCELCTFSQIWSQLLNYYANGKSEPLSPKPFIIGLAGFSFMYIRRQLDRYDKTKGYSYTQLKCFCLSICMHVCCSPSINWKVFICENKTTLINLWYINLAPTYKLMMETTIHQILAPSFPPKTFWLAIWLAK